MASDAKIQFGEGFPTLLDYDKVKWSIGMTKTVEFFPNKIFTVKMVSSLDPNLEKYLNELDEDSKTSLNDQYLSKYEGKIAIDLEWEVEINLFQFCSPKGRVLLIRHPDGLGNRVLFNFLISHKFYGKGTDSDVKQLHRKFSYLIKNDNVNVKSKVIQKKNANPKSKKKSKKKKNTNADNENNEDTSNNNENADQKIDHDDSSKNENEDSIKAKNEDENNSNENNTISLSTFSFPKSRSIAKKDFSYYFLEFNKLISPTLEETINNIDNLLKEINEILQVEESTIQIATERFFRCNPSYINTASVLRSNIIFKVQEKIHVAEQILFVLNQNIFPESKVLNESHRIQILLDELVSIFDAIYDRLSRNQIICQNISFDFNQIFYIFFIIFRPSVISRLNFFIQSNNIFYFF